MRAERLYTAGYRDPDQVLAAQPPEIPDAATRILLRNDQQDERSYITSDPAAARAWLADEPARWRSDLIRIER